MEKGQPNTILGDPEMSHTVASDDQSSQEDGLGHAWMDDQSSQEDGPGHAASDDQSSQEDGPGHAASDDQSSQEDGPGHVASDDQSSQEDGPGHAASDDQSSQEDGPGHVASDDQSSQEDGPGHAASDDQSSQEDGPGHAASDDQSSQEDGPGHAASDDQSSQEDGPGHAASADQSSQEDGPGHAASDDQSSQEDGPGHAASDDQSSQEDGPGHAGSVDQSSQKDGPGHAASDDQSSQEDSPGHAASVDQSSQKDGRGHAASVDQSSQKDGRGHAPSVDQSSQKDGRGHAASVDQSSQKDGRSHAASVDQSSQKDGRGHAASVDQSSQKDGRGHAASVDQSSQKDGPGHASPSTHADPSIEEPPLESAKLTEGLSHGSHDTPLSNGMSEEILDQSEISTGLKDTPQLLQNQPESDIPRLKQIPPEASQNNSLESFDSNLPLDVQDNRVVAENDSVITAEDNRTAEENTSPSSLSVDPPHQSPSAPGENSDNCEVVHANSKDGAQLDKATPAVEDSQESVSEKLLREEVAVLSDVLRRVEEQRVQEVESLVEQLVLEQQDRAQEIAAYKMKFCTLTQEKELLKEDIEILQKNLGMEETERQSESINNNRIITGLKRQYNEFANDNDKLKEKVTTLNLSLVEYQRTKMDWEHKNKQYKLLIDDNNAMKDELKMKDQIIQNHHHRNGELVDEVKQLEMTIQDTEEHYQAQVESLYQKQDHQQSKHQDKLTCMLMHGVVCGCVAVVREALDAGADIEAITTSDDSGRRALHLAASVGGDKEVTRLLLKAGAQHTACDYYGDQAVHIASVGGHSEVVELLVTREPKLALATDRQGYTAGQLAAVKGHINILEVLARVNQSSLTTKTLDGHTLLHFSIANDQLHTTHWLLSQSQSLGLRDLVGPQAMYSSQFVHFMVERWMVLAGWLRLFPIFWCVLTHWPVKHMGLKVYSWLKGRQKLPWKKCLTIKEDRKPIYPGGGGKANKNRHRQSHSQPYSRPAKEEPGSHRSQSTKGLQNTVDTPESACAPSRGVPKSEPDSTPPPGLANLGNTCYMNSVLQCLHHTQPLTQHLSLSLPRCEGKKRRKIALVYQRLSAALTSGQNIHNAVSNLKKEAGKFDSLFLDNNQKDAHDFLTALMTWLHDDLTTTSGGGSIMSKLFHGSRLSSFRCRVVEQEVCRVEESFVTLCLSLSHPNTTTLQELLEDNYSPREVLWLCDKCNKQHPCHHTTPIIKLPRVLVILISRNNQNHKAAVSFPVEDLRMDGLLLDSSVSHPGYELYGVCSHEGTMRGGHYTAYCRTWDNSQWFFFDDAHTAPVELQRVLEQHNAHILFYKQTQD